MESIESINKFLQLLSEAPDGQIDKQITSDIKKLIGKDVSDIKLGIVKAIDLCVYCGLASTAGLMSLNIFHEHMLDGTPADFDDENCPWRNK